MVFGWSSVMANSWQGSPCFDTLALFMILQRSRLVCINNNVQLLNIYWWLFWVYTLSKYILIICHNIIWIHSCLSFQIKICFGYQIVFKSSYWSVQNRFNKCWSTCICIINKQNEERQVCRVLIHCVPTVIQGTTGKPLLVKIGQIQIFYTGDCSDKDRASATVKCVPIVRINGQLVIWA